MDEQPKLGDIVRLKIGGPKMTVEGQSDNGYDVDCVWFVQVDGGWEGPIRDTFHRMVLVDATNL